MPIVPNRVADITEEQIEEWGYLGLSEKAVFDLLKLNDRQRKTFRNTEKWKMNYNKGLARRELELAKRLESTKDASLIRELLRSTTLVDKKIESREEIEIDAPQWLKPKINRKKKKNNEVEN